MNDKKLYQFMSIKFLLLLAKLLRSGYPPPPPSPKSSKAWRKHCEERAVFTQASRKWLSNIKRTDLKPPNSYNIRIC